jgi:hypothetical protein
VSYEEIRADLCEGYGWSFADVDGMSFEQIDSACRHGKKREGIPIATAEDVHRIARDWRKYYGI